MKELGSAGDRRQGGACGWRRGVAEGERRRHGAGSRGKGRLGSRGERGRRAARETAGGESAQGGGAVERESARGEGARQELGREKGIRGSLSRPRRRQPPALTPSSRLLPLFSLAIGSSGVAPGALRGVVGCRQPPALTPSGCRVGELADLGSKTIQTSSLPWPIPSPLSFLCRAPPSRLSPSCSFPLLLPLSLLVFSSMAGARPPLRPCLPSFLWFFSSRPTFAAASASTDGGLDDAGGMSSDGGLGRDLAQGQLRSFDV